MRSLIVTSLVIFLLATGPLAAWQHSARTGWTFWLDQHEQALPKKLLVTVPIMHTIARGESPLSIDPGLGTSFGPGDPRNNSGKVILLIKVVREDKVVWKKKLRDRVRSDWDDELYCGNCTHDLWTCGFEDDLEQGDIVFFKFRLKGMPRFHAGDVVNIGVEFSNSCEREVTAG
jgi:hypothetical protein